MMQIMAIGGGDVGAMETEAIDREFIATTQKTDPRLLFIPTASEDSPAYMERITRAYESMGCAVDVLRLLTEGESALASEKIESADFIYVGGGNTKAMLLLWREVGVDQMLIQAARAGKPVGGLSAGSICWFRVGNSDWPQYEGIPGVNTARLDCLGLVDLVACPHTARESFRLGEFTEMMRHEQGFGVGFDDCAAFQLRDDTYRIVSSQPGAVAHLIWWEDGRARHRILEPSREYFPLNTLTHV